MRHVKFRSHKPVRWCSCFPGPVLTISPADFNDDSKLYKPLDQPTLLFVNYNSEGALFKVLSPVKKKLRKAGVPGPASWHDAKSQKTVSAGAKTEATFTSRVRQSPSSREDVPRRVLLRFLGLPPSAAPPSSPRGLQEKSEPKPLTGILSPGMGVEEGWATDPQLTLMAEGENDLRCHWAPGGKGPLRKDEGSIHECLCVPTLSPRKPRREGAPAQSAHLGASPPLSPGSPTGE